MICITLLLASIPVSAFEDAAIDPVLGSAEMFFLSLKSRNFPVVWNLLTARSRGRIAEEVYDASSSSGGTMTRAEIEQDFAGSGIVSTSYWSAFLDTFDPEMILEESRWEIGSLKEHAATIIITHKRASTPAVLKLSKEDGIWKVGLVETFWARKALW